VYTAAFSPKSLFSQKLCRALPDPSRVIATVGGEGEGEGEGSGEEIVFDDWASSLLPYPQPSCRNCCGKVIDEFCKYKLQAYYFRNITLFRTVNCKNHSIS
jgi:hypothetical protein